jgi:hypothetical protein
LSRYDDKKQLKCSFCGKSQEQVKRLVAGPGVYICDECIELCSEIIEEEFEDTRVEKAGNAKYLAGSIAMDGVVSEDEWGAPVKSVYGREGMTVARSRPNTYPFFFTMYDYGATPVDHEETKFSYYFGYDEEYLYCAANVEGWLWDKLSHGTELRVVVGQYVPYTIVPTFEYLGETYEKVFAAAYRGDGDSVDLKYCYTPGSSFRDTYAPTEDDVAIGPGGYELRIPWHAIGSLPLPGAELAVSVSIELPDWTAKGTVGDTMMWHKSSGNISNFAWPGRNCGNNGMSVITLGEKVGKKEDVHKADVYIEKRNDTVAIDGKISESEYGTAVYSASAGSTNYFPDNDRRTDPAFDFWVYDPEVEGVNFELVTENIYMVWDETYLYYGQTIENYNWTDKDTRLYLLAAAHDPETTVNVITFGADGAQALYEQYARMEFYRDSAGNIGFWDSCQGFDVNQSGFIEGEDYVINYNESSNTMTYEVRVPWSRLGFDKAKAGDLLTMSSAVELAQYNGAYPNVIMWHRAAKTAGGPNTFVCADSSAVVMLVDEDTPIAPEEPEEPEEPGIQTDYSVLKAKEGSIEIDGVVTAEEWGDPTEAAWISKGYESETDMFWSWEFVPGYQPDASYEVYYRYDDEYLYFACTAHNIKPGNDLAGERLERHWENEYWKRGGMWLGVSTYEDALATTPEAMKMTKIMFSLLDNGQKYAAHDMVLGHWCTEYETVKFQKLAENDYAIVWDEPDLTYEVRIPWSMITTGETPKAGDHIVTSVAVKMNMIADNPASESNGGNVMMWGQGVMGMSGITLNNSGIILRLADTE